MTARFGSICDRCGTPYLAPFIGHDECPDCQLGALTSAERRRLNNYIARTGKQAQQ